MIQRLIAFITRTSTATEESDTEYDGLLSTAPEWHAVEYGLGLGFLTGLALLVRPELGAMLASTSAGVVLEAMHRDAPGRLPIARRYIKQIRRELHYYLGAFVAGVAPWVPFVDVAGIAQQVFA